MDKCPSLCVRFSRTLHGCYSNEHAGCKINMLHVKMCGSGTHCMKTSMWLKCNASVLRTVCSWGILSPWLRDSQGFSASKSIYKQNAFYPYPAHHPCPSIWEGFQLGPGPLLLFPAITLTFSPWHSNTFNLLGHYRQTKW